MSVKARDLDTPRLRSRTRRPALLAVTVVATMVASLAQALLLPAPQAAAVDVGKGSYAEGTPPGGGVPGECISTPIKNPRAHTTENFPDGAIPTNDWWTSLLWRKFNCSSVSEPLMAHPYTFKAFTNGMAVGYPTEATITGTSTGVGEYHYAHAEDFRLGVAGLDTDGKVDDYSDWTVTEKWQNGSSSLRTTIGHGLPFVYATKTGSGNATLSTKGTPDVWSDDGATIGFTINGHDYAAFAPSGSTWNVAGSSISSSLNGGDYFSVAVLPTTEASSDADRTAALAEYAPYAHNHVTGTTVSWDYDETSATMTSTYTFETTAHEGTATGTVYALYPHQRDMLEGATPSDHTYVSPRGPMSVVVGSSEFRTEAKFNGVLPQLANTGFPEGSPDAAQLDRYIKQVANNDPFAGFGNDTYWTGKAFGRMNQVIQMANLTGDTASRDTLLTAMRTRMNDWLTASPGETTRSFWYNEDWGTLVGFPASYGSDTELNDHHFHYGYFIVGAATLAQFDPQWATDEEYGAMVDLLIKDAANWDRSDTQFPFLRDFDIYAGHDWASGHGAFGAGNNQESSSEGMNFASGLIHWGEVTGDDEIRDLGIYLYTTQASAIENYWFDTDDEAFPEEFGHSTVGMVWGDGGAYATWFSAEPEMIQGINLLPSTAGHLYLGYNPEYIKRNIAELERNNGGPAQVWKDIIWEFQALGDAPTALAQFRAQADAYPVEEGESRAHTLYWLKNLDGLGTVDRRVTADTPLHAVFTKDGVRTYQAANMGQEEIRVTFSDGVRLDVPAGSVASSTGEDPGDDPDDPDDPKDVTPPTAPTDLQASEITPSSVKLAWGASTDDSGKPVTYEVLRNGTVVTTVSTTSATIGGLAQTTTYEFAVRAVDKARNRSASSEPISVTTTKRTTIPATSTIQAEDFTEQSGLVVEPTTDTGGGSNVATAANGDHLLFKDVDFGSTARTTFSARVASGASGGVSGLVNVRLGSPTSPSIGSFAIGNTGGWQSWRTVPADIAATTGRHDVYITFDSGQPADFVNVNWLVFGPGGGESTDDPGDDPDDPGDPGDGPESWDATSTIEAEQHTASAGVTTESTTDTGGGQNIAGVANGDWVSFAKVDFGADGLATFKARVASGASGGVSGLVNVRLGSRTGPSIGSFAIGNTGGWQSWRTVPANIARTTGVHDVYLTFDSGQPADFVNVNWVTFAR